MLNAPRDSRLVRHEILEIRDALEAFRAAVEVGEITAIDSIYNGDSSNLRRNSEFNAHFTTSDEPFAH
jgi:hypothetical protein